MNNSTWGALAGFSRQPAPPASKPESFSGPTASMETKAARSSDAELRLELAQVLKHDRDGYETALEIQCWLSKSKKGGAVLVDEMDSAYIINTMKMIAEGRHPVVKPDTSLGLGWAGLFKSVIAKREREANRDDDA